MIIVPLTFRVLLFICMHMRPRDRREALVLKPKFSINDWADTIMEMPGDHYAFALPTGEPVAAGGWFSMEDPAVRGSWLVATPKIHLLGEGLHRFAVRAHEAMIKDGVRLFQTLGLDDGDAASTRWLDRLKYKPDRNTSITGAQAEPMVLWRRKV